MEDHLLAMRGTKRFFPIAALLFEACAVYGGQGLVLTPSVSGTLTSPNLPQTQDWRIELQIHSWTVPSASFAFIADDNGVGMSASLQPGSLLWMIDKRDAISGGAVCQLSLAGMTSALVRFQRIRQSNPQQIECEAWNYDGTLYNSSVVAITGINTWGFSGGALGSSLTTTDLDFYRVCTNTIAMGSRPPTTAGACSWTELKFDGTLTDSSGNHHDASLSSPTYAATTNQTATAIAKTFNTPSWTNWVSMRAGFPNRLDGTASYSQADAGDSVSYYWSQIAGPTILRWSDHTQAQPTVTGAIFGTYTLRLTVKDAAGNSASNDLQVGAVATDDNGVVVNADPRVDQIFGPMIAFGKNPWAYADEQALNGTNLRLAAYTTASGQQTVVNGTTVNGLGLNPPQWATAGQGTVSYNFEWQPCTTLSSAITASATSISIANASCLNLSTLPTWIMLGNFGTQEFVRISATTATNGPATLTVAYNGRGLTGFTNFSTMPESAQAWAAGTAVSQGAVMGTGTKFITDSNRPLCPAGAPGPGGAIVYSTGTATLAANGTTITGNGTSWTQATNVNAGDFIRIAATHAGGTSFVYWAKITSVNSTTQISVDRPLPSDVDAGPFTYAMTAPRYVSLEFTAPDGATQRAWHYLQGCESETQAFEVWFYDVASIAGTTFSGMKYSYIDTLGAAGPFGPNLYGEDLSHLALWLRSGYSSAQTAATIMSRYWVKGPEVGGGWLGGIPLVQGGGKIGAVANLLFNPQVGQSCPSIGCLGWTDVRASATAGYSALNGADCDTWDSRDSGYLAAWLALGADYDPNAAQRAIWKTDLAAVLTREASCKQADNSWSNTNIFVNSSGVNVSLTNGSTAVTGSGFTAGVCDVIASGTVTMTNGSSAFTGMGLVNGASIVITAGGKDYLASFVQSGGTSGHLSYLWPAPSGTYSYVIRSGSNLIAIGTDYTDHANLARNYACKFNSASSLTLNKPWTGATGTFSMRSNPVLIGLGQQSYMMGIKTHYLYWAKNSGDAGLAAQASALTPLIGQWIHDVGYDPSTQGMNYGRGFDWCEPTTATDPAQTQSLRQGQCNYGGDPIFIKAARALTAETSKGLEAYYDAQGGSAAAVAFGDKAYGSLWGNCGMTAPGYYCDGDFDDLDTSNGSLAAQKWEGFFFGMGMAQQWPAVRLGGVAAARNRTVYLSLNLGSAAKAQVVVTAPSGAATTFTCTSAPCAVTVDDRQGAHWFQVEYETAGGAVVAETEPDLLAVP
jgi:hypothetical protein